MARPTKTINPAKRTFTTTDIWISLPAKGFLPKASTPFVATRPKYINPSAKATAATIPARRYLKEARGERNVALPTSLRESMRLVRVSINELL